ncbi:restriction endonuclease subunit S [Actinomadura adrarensis]|uniref:Restriction endonuclease subunit S n=1 Tax=Actinomadura adrarensis TaxID=1819600 RepID=A0ABW3CC52_9ACTN
MIELDLPEEWKLESIGRSVLSLADGPFGSNLASKHYTDSGARVIRLGNIGAGQFKDSDRAFISMERYRALKKHSVAGGDVIVAGLGDENNPLGRSCVTPDDLGPAIVKADCFRVRVDPKRLDPRFLVYFLSSSLGEWAAKTRSRGSTRQRMNLRDVAALSFPRPGLEEQWRIVDFLDAETARIDQLLRLRALQRRTLVERSLACSSNYFPVDGSVDMVRLGYLATVQSGVTVDGSRSIKGQAVTRPYLRVANVQAGRLDLESITEITVPVGVARAATLQPGDVLMTEGGDLDKLGRGTVWRGEIPGCLHQNHVFAVRPESKLNPDYLALLTRSAYARRYFESTGTRTTNLASTSSAKIRDFRIPLFSAEGQRSIVQRVTSEVAKIEAVIVKLDRQRSLLEERRRALITAAVTGQLDVTTARGTA